MATERDGVSEADRLHLVYQVADEVGRRYGVDPCDLWAVGTIAYLTAEKRHDPKRGPLLPFLRVRVRQRMIDSLSSKKKR